MEKIERGEQEKKDKAAFTRQTKVGKLVLANLSWCVSLNGIKQSANTFLFDANSLQTCLPPVFVPFTHTNFGLPSRVCQLKFAVWRPLKRVVGKKDDLLIFISSLWRKKSSIRARFFKHYFHKSGRINPVKYQTISLSLRKPQFIL